MNSPSNSLTPPSRSRYVPTYRDEHALVGYLLDVLEDRLAGRNAERRINTHPLDWCLLGALGPEKVSHTPVEAVPEQPDVDPNVSAEVAASETVSATNASAVEPNSKPEPDDSDSPRVRERPDDSRGTRRPPSALGFEVLLRPDADGYVEFHIDTSFCVFTKHLPSFAEQTSLPIGSPLAEVGQRHTVSVSNITVRFRPGDHSVNDGGVVQHALDSVLSAAFGRDDADRAWRTRPQPFDEHLTSPEAFAAYLATIIPTEEKLKWDVRAQVEIRCLEREDGLVRVGCYLRNMTPETPAEVKNRGQRDAYLTIGDGRLAVRVLAGEILPIEILPVPRDYQYDRRVWGVGHNTSVRVDRAAAVITTHALARYEQVRIVTQDRPSAKFAELANDPISVLAGIEQAMRAYLEDWRTRILARNALGLDSESLGVCANDADGFEDEIRRFSCGIAALLADERLMEAFKAANRVFGRVAVGYDSWRLFQIVFFVIQLPALAIREGKTSGLSHDGQSRDWSDCLEWGDVLWFRTGGGKTEAYLGLSCCAMLYDRLRGKAFGVTAWLRLPLRMLSIQQLQRAMRVIWEAEQERKTLLGPAASASDSLRLGYFVGSTVTPNDISEELLQRYDNPEMLERLQVIPDCPNCRERGSIRVSIDKKEKRFRHICGKCAAELPLDVTDGEVYRYLPSLVVGTVDKMATVGQQSKFGILWGGASWKCPQHGYALGDYCSFFGCKNRRKGGTPVTPRDPSPTLHIQDELHLLQEELGAFAGHYETLIRFCERSLSARPSKIIAATATIEGFERQVQHLYGTRGARRFPGRGYDRNSNFYSGPDVDADGQPKAARVFVAFKSASLSPADASARVTEILQTEATHLVKNPHLALAFLTDACTVDDMQALLRFYTTTLNYVGSLARGSRVRQVLEDAGGRVRETSDRELNVEYTNSRSTGSEVTAVVHQIENPPPWSDASFLDALVATNMISHGVDLERVNLMTMDGVPDQTAEYIQASSRSGRRHVGAVIVVLADYSLRAASIYHRFLEYHDHLDRMVAPVPVNRFAKYAVDRTLPGVTMGLLYGLHAAKDNNVGLSKRHAAESLINGLGTEFETEVEQAYAIGDGIYDSRLEQSLTHALHEGVDRVRMCLRGSHEAQTKDALRPAPMMSLRDVEAGVQFWPDGDPGLLLFVQRTRE